MTISIRPCTPPPVVALDHVPSDAEAAVYFPHRAVGSSVHRRVDGDCELWEVPRLPLGCLAVWMLLMAAAIALLRWYLGNDDGDSSLLIAFGIPIFFTLLAIAWFIDDQAKSVNPVVVVDHARRELRVNGRDEPIAVADVVEVIVWTLTRDNRHALMVNDEAMDVRQTSAVVRRGEGFELIYLFDDEGILTNIKRRGLLPRIERVDAAQQMAEALGVPLRKIGDLPVARDVRPRRYPKRPEEITKQFGKRKS